MDPTTFKDYLFLIPLLPFAGAAINGILGRRLGLRAVHLIALGSVLGSFVLSVAGFLALVSIKSPEARRVVSVLYQWILIAGQTGSFHINVAFLLDPLSSVMCLVVTGVGFFIHVYSVGYMHGDPGRARYFAYLNLFTFSMLVLVLADNLLLMFVGWEGVGLCSYLLIGFWFSELDNARAGMKAFIANRVGDFGFFVGLMLLFWTLYVSSGQAVGSLSYGELKGAAPLLLDAEPILGLSVPTIICLALFMGATGKSAQIPLYVWLPDAMAGPTPVSALIHAATMVTAGVFMIVRLNFLYLLSPVALSVVATVGALTALYAASIAITQNDIKKVLAYSTISQLGYMFLGVGVSAFAAGIFHLVTHAFFKALLFLGAGSLIHAAHTNDIRKMGGLRAHMPATFFTFMVAFLAIAGIPPFAGFFSKDEILFSTFNAHLAAPGLGKLLWLVGLMGAGLTAFYMTRLVIVTFFGEFRGGESAEEKLHESPRTMTGPLVILAVLSAVGGFIGLPAVTHLPNLIGGFLEPVVALKGGAASHGSHSAALELGLMAVSVAAAAAGIYLGWYLYHKRPELPGALRERFKNLHAVVYNKYYVDEAYDRLFVRPVIAISRGTGRFDLGVIDWVVNALARATERISAGIGWEDLKVVDGLVNAIADAVKYWGYHTRRLTTGKVNHYLYSVVLGLFVLYLLVLIT